MRNTRDTRVRIYISTFDKKVIHISGGIPIEVGAARRQHFLYDVCDNTGENISNENEYYGELSGLFWIWKNTDILSDDIIGYCHYNKCLDISRKKIMKFFMVDGRVQHNHWITLKPVKNRDHQVQEEVDAIVSILKTDYPACYEIWCQQYDDCGRGRGEVCRTCNMFLTTGESFNQYCEFLFDVLGKMRTIVGDKPDVDLNMRRYCAFMGERLLSVYICANQGVAMSVDARYKQWYLRWIIKIASCLRFDKSSKIYKYMRKLLGCKSSYGRENGDDIK